jgi:hypothetical protein
MAFRLRPQLSALALAGAMAACATKTAVPAGTPCEVTATRAQFYKYGPAQAFGADETLAQGTRVTMVQRDFGFSRVMLASGTTGYVSTDELRPLPPEPPPKQRTATARVVTNRKLPRLFSAPVKRSNVQSTPGDPLFDINDVPAKMEDTPAKQPPEGELPKP